MAEIHVEPKKHSSGASWIWILLGLIIIGVIAYFVLNNNRTNENEEVQKTNTTSYINAPQPLLMQPVSA
ncbi:MAG TPA: hypothetical protein VEZ55_03045 [Chitinophagaceae bacterium]|jgi:hypothetical protein|nr:hypothetical protein [Chitinophagaceae bacterium]